ncbi:recombinase family protein [Lactococcus insecticola]|uniref:Recombinase family protein n=1 Tax=Pseudolactococcus insecticola TaxID=2709158 RepID=A0A6A0B4D3_9LACT|nr:recombinase family protein [Lactococcus insecticola]GFH40219.1 hypothetical protein Hs20B_06170 [Lactococcus insecticola]
MKTIQKIDAKTPQFEKRKRVAAYARVSVEKGRTMHSLSAQVSYYSSYIQNNPEWAYVGVYSDGGISGTSTGARTEFQRMIADCEKGQIDIILTKSISRFARNTVDLLETVRHLREIGVEVRFEKENIRSLSGDGELMLSILASFAQEESRSISENIKWVIQKRYKQGLPNSKQNLYGYRWIGEELIVVPEEAENVKFIFDSYLNKISAEQTAKKLNEMGCKSFRGGRFGGPAVRAILLNITYTGTLHLQKEYIVDSITKKSKRNKGELPQYFVENHHEPIISMETWHAVTEERARRLSEGATSNWSLNTTCFTSKIKCGHCGKNFQRKQRKKIKSPYRYWCCATKNNKGKKYCQSCNIKEWQLEEISAEVLGLSKFDSDVFINKIKQISIQDHELIFLFKDGHSETRTYESHTSSRTPEWTREMRTQMSEFQKNKWRERRDKESNNNTSNDWQV